MKYATEATNKLVSQAAGERLHHVKRYVTEEGITKLKTVNTVDLQDLTNSNCPPSVGDLVRSMQPNQFQMRPEQALDISKVSSMEPMDNMAASKELVAQVEEIKKTLAAMQNNKVEQPKQEKESE